MKTTLGLYCVGTKFQENISKGLRVIEWMQFAYCNLQMGHNSIKNVGGVKVLVLCTSYNNTLYLYQILSTSISKGFRVSDLNRMVDASVVANADRRMYERINRKKTGSL